MHSTRSHVGRLVLVSALFATAAASDPAFAKTESPYGGTPWAVPGTVQAEDFDNGGQNVSYYNPDGANIYGQYRPKTKVSIEASTDTGGGYDVAATRTGEWMNYTVKAAQAGTFTLQVRVASAGQGGTFHFLVDGASATPTLTVPDTGGWQTWTTLSTSIAIGAGKHIVQLHFDQVSAATANIGNFNWISFTTASSGGAKQKVMSYLQSVSGNHTLVGQHNKFNNDPAGATDQVTAITGRAPAYWNADFGWGTDQIGNRQKMTNEAMRQYRSGALIGLMFHTCAPTGDEYCSWDDIGTPGKSKQLTNDQFTQLTTPGTALYNTWISRLDELVPFFQQIKDAGQAVMFRPLHEMNQCVFWWACHTGPNGSARLYQITHDYLAYTKGLDNIIWNWNVQDFPSLSSDLKTYDPGAAYHDMISLDVYDGGYTTSNYNLMLGASGGQMIAIGECHWMPTAAELAAQPKWVFTMLWPDYIDDNKPTLPALYKASNVTTLDEMPGWH